MRNFNIPKEKFSLKERPNKKYHNIYHCILYTNYPHNIQNIS